MAAAGISTYRDRTSEFIAFSENFKRTASPPNLNSRKGNNTVRSASNSNSANVTQSEFNKKASRIGLGIHETTQKIARLTKLAKKSSMFDDPALEIQELTALIKGDISSLNEALSSLESLQNLVRADGNLSKDSLVHTTTICDDLKKRLMSTAKHFKDVLTTRTESLKAHESRKQLFSANASPEKNLMQKPTVLAEPPPWSKKPNDSDVTPPTMLSSGGASTSSSSHLRRRLGSEASPSHSMEVQMLQQTVPRQENYMSSRAAALQNVESTISELGGIFTQLATMVAQQGELAIRIDDNMDETLSNVEGARGALLKHLNRVSSNRWLLIKIFGILIVFMIIFILFVL